LFDRILSIYFTKNVDRNHIHTLCGKSNVTAPKVMTIKWILRRMRLHIFIHWHRRSWGVHGAVISAGQE